MISLIKKTIMMLILMMTTMTEEVHAWPTSPDAPRHSENVGQVGESWTGDIVVGAQHCLLVDILNASVVHEPV